MFKNNEDYVKKKKKIQAMLSIPQLWVIVHTPAAPPPNHTLKKKKKKKGNRGVRGMRLTFF